MAAGVRQQTRLAHTQSCSGTELHKLQSEMAKAGHASNTSGSRVVRRHKDSAERGTDDVNSALGNFTDQRKACKSATARSERCGVESATS